MRIGICDDDRRIAEILAEDIRWIYRTDVVLIAFDKISSLLIYIEEETEKNWIFYSWILCFEKNGEECKMGSRPQKKFRVYDRKSRLFLSVAIAIMYRKFFR